MRGCMKVLASKPGAMAWFVAGAADGTVVRVGSGSVGLVLIRWLLYVRFTRVRLGVVQVKENANTRLFL